MRVGYPNELDYSDPNDSFVKKLSQTRMLRHGIAGQIASNSPNRSAFRSPKNFTRVMRSSNFSLEVQ